VRLSVPALVLRLEGLLVLGAAVALYVDGDFPIWPLPAFFLAPDLAFAAYLGGPRVGAVAYNLTHTYVVPSRSPRVRSWPARAASPSRSH
jgi:hypothetical protein